MFKKVFTSLLAVSTVLVVCAVNSAFATLLADAATNGNLAEVERLLATEDVNQSDETGFTALHGAACNGHTKIVRLLLDQGAKVNYAGQCGDTALFGAVVRGHTHVVRLLLDHGSNVDYAAGPGETTVLMQATLLGDTDMVQLLIEKGADLNRADRKGNTALVMAEDRRTLAIYRMAARGRYMADKRSYIEIAKMLRNPTGTTGVRAKYAARRVLNNNPGDDRINQAMIEATNMYGHDVVKVLYETGRNQNLLLKKAFARGFILHCRKIFEGRKKNIYDLLEDIAEVTRASEHPRTNGTQ